MRTPGDRACADLDRPPLATKLHPFGAHGFRYGPVTMTIALHLNRHAARDRAGHPVGGQPSAGEFSHADGHALASEAVGQASDGGGDHLGILVCVAAHLVLPTINLAAQRGALHQNIFEAEPDAPAMPMLGVWALGQVQLRLLHSKRPFEGLLHAHHALRLAAPSPGHGHPRQSTIDPAHCTPRSRSRSGVTSPRASITLRMVVLTMLG